MTYPVRLVALCVGQPGDERRRWGTADIERLLRPSPASVSGRDRCTIGDYWADVTDGEVDLKDTLVLPWFTLPRDHQAWRLLERCHEPSSAAADLKAGLQSLVDACILEQPGEGLHEFAARARRTYELTAADVVVVLTTADSPLHWAQHVRIDKDEYRPAAYLSASATHTSFAHEIGHLLGYQHSFGLNTGGVGEEYGDPYCIMSARRFGGRSHQVTHALVRHDLLPDEPLWSMVGPRIARATAWAQRTDWASPSSDDVRVLNRPATPEPVRLAHTALPVGPHPRLIVVQASTGKHWVTLELRGPLPGVETSGVDWDAALALDRIPGMRRALDRDTADSPGLVIHEVDPVTRQVTYRGTIVLPLAGDTDARVGEGDDAVVVRATGYQDGIASVLIGGPPAVAMVWTRAQVVRAHDEGVRRVELRALTTGYDQPLFSWSVEGVSVVANSRLGDPPVRTALPVPGNGTDLSDRTVVMVEASWDVLVIDLPASPDVVEPLVLRLDASEGSESRVRALHPDMVYVGGDRPGPGPGLEGAGQVGVEEFEIGHVGEILDRDLIPRPDEPRIAAMAVDGDGGRGLTVTCHAWSTSAMDRGAQERLHPLPGRPAGVPGPTASTIGVDNL
jgi:hypothetical protein